MPAYHLASPRPLQNRCCVGCFLPPAADVRRCARYSERGRALWPFTCLYNLFCAPPHVHAATPVKTQPGWPLRLGYLCGAGHEGYYIRLLSQKIILPCGLLGFSLCICQVGSHAVTQRKRTVWIHTNTPCFSTHPSVFLIKTTTQNS